MKKRMVGLVLVAMIAALTGILLSLPESAHIDRPLCPPIGTCSAGDRTGIEGTRLVERHRSHVPESHRVFQSEVVGDQLLLYFLREVPSDCMSYDYRVQVGDTLHIRGWKAPVSPAACDAAPGYLLDIRTVEVPSGPVPVRWEIEGVMDRTRWHVVP